LFVHPKIIGVPKFDQTWKLGDLFLEGVPLGAMHPHSLPEEMCARVQDHAILNLLVEYLEIKIHFCSRQIRNHHF